MQAVVKRLLNVLVLGCSAYFLLLIWMALTNQVADWIVFGQNFIPVFITYMAILAINYIGFEKITIWHKKISDGRKVE